VTVAYNIEPLAGHHDRTGFRCGIPELDTYFEQRAGQDAKRNLAAVFVLIAEDGATAGFYSLSSHSILATELPAELEKKLPRFPLPVTLLGRMAVAQSYQGRGLGEFLLIDALHRALLGSVQVASWAVVVDAKAGARSFYLKHEFIPMAAHPDRLFLPMKTIAAMFAS